MNTTEHSTMTLMPLPAAGVLSGTPSDLIAVVHAAGMLSIVTVAATVRIHVVRRERPDTGSCGTLFRGDMADLIVECAGRRQDVLATGTPSDMEAMRDLIAGRMIRAHGNRQRGFRRAALLAGCTIAGLVVGVFLASPMPVPNPMSLPTMLPAHAPGGMGAPLIAPAGRAGAGLIQPNRSEPDPASVAPASVAPASVAPTRQGAIYPQTGANEDISDIARRLRESLGNAKPMMPGAISRPRTPVTLDDDTPALQTAKPIFQDNATSPEPPTYLAPASRAPASLAPDVAPVPPSPAASIADPAKARLLLATLQGLRETLDRGGTLTPEMLATLPPDIASRLGASMEPSPKTAAAPSGATLAPAASVRLTASDARQTPNSGADQRLGTDALVRAQTDAYGIADVPDANTWAGHGGAIAVPLPKGGDIRTTADMARFGLTP